MTKLRAAVDNWMVDAYIEPWRAYVASKRARGHLEKVGTVWVDVTTVVDKPFTCDSTVCSPGTRKRGHQSCCAELTAEITPKEVKRLQPHFAAISQFLAARDPSWAKVKSTKAARMLDDCITHDDDNKFQLNLAKREKRCTFSFVDERGAILCGIHGYALENNLDVHEVKPNLCFIFPMVVVDLMDDSFLLSVLDEENGQLLGFSSHKELACLHGSKTFGQLDLQTPPFYDSQRSTLVHMFGARFLDGLDELAARRDERHAALLAKPPIDGPKRVRTNAVLPPNPAPAMGGSSGLVQIEPSKRAAGKRTVAKRGGVVTKQPPKKSGPGDVHA